MRAVERYDRERAAARAYEAALPSGQRKRLGQFFTGMPLGRLLAHLALEPGTRAVLDPMAGHGDLLDAVWEAADARSVQISRLDGIEIDRNTASVCRERLSGMSKIHGSPARRILTGSAFDPDVVSRLQQGGYDLVITNPPYVRYQVRKECGLGDDSVRAGLSAIAGCYTGGPGKNVWLGMIRGCSGLADLSIPSWLLAGMLVRAGGRLALVAPATWRSRDYADVVRYMLLRCFELEYVVEDARPGWFDGALVRTHLVVAKRLPPEDAAKQLRGRAVFPVARWIRIAPKASGGRSLVGGVFEDSIPEAAMVEWLGSKPKDGLPGIELSSFDLRQEQESLNGRVGAKVWYRRLEETSLGLRPDDLPCTQSRFRLPDEVASAVGGNVEGLVALEEAGVRVGQGLRTGCNRFFYVTACSASDGGMVRVRSSPELGGMEFSVPGAALLPVLRRQSETAALHSGHPPPGRVLDLRDWALPEDARTATSCLAAYRAAGEAPPQAMPDELADFVRLAARWPDGGTAGVKRIPDMAAVRTNVRTPPDGDGVPRFWYMLPDFAPRHVPSAFVARVNHGHPWAEANLDPPILVDANFCTLWSAQGIWTGFGLKALLNSTWCRALMESIGTRLGGGALKLEATHLRRMPVPRLSRVDLEGLHTAGVRLARGHPAAQRSVDSIVLGRVLGVHAGERERVSVSRRLAAAARTLLFERRGPTT